MKALALALAIALDDHTVLDTRRFLFFPSIPKDEKIRLRSPSNSFDFNDAYLNAVNGE